MGEVLSDEVRMMGADKFRLSYVLTQALPPTENVTTGFGLIFRQEALLLIENRKWGMSLPGGHVEPPETPAEAMRREVREESSVHVGTHRMFAYEEIRILTDPIPASYKYPVPSYQCFFVGIAASVDRFLPNDEASAAGFFVPSDPEFSKWVDNDGALMLTIYDRAREVVAELR